MSKYLVKILSICAFVVILPLAILATALCVTESASYSVKLYLAGNTSEAATSKVLINGKERENNELKFGKNAEVIISFEATGYDFDGWYIGTDKTYEGKNEIKSENKVYSFKITQNMDLTAVCHIMNYNVTFTGTYEDETTPVELEAAAYEYGTALPVLTAVDETKNIRFMGWSLVDNTSDIFYKNATFDKSGEVEVKAVWSNQKSVNYYDTEGNVIYSNNYTPKEFSNFEFLTGTETNVLNALKDGYEFGGWGDDKGNAIDLQSLKDNFTTDTLNIYLKQNLITYTVHAQFNEKQPDTISDLTYDVVNGFSDYTAVRTYYNFVGFNYQDKLYTKIGNSFLNGMEDLGSVIAKGADREITVTAVWKSEYESLNIMINASNKAQDKGIYGYKLDEDNNPKYMPIYDETVMTLAFNDTEKGHDYVESVFSTMLSEYSAFYIKNGADYIEVNLYSLRIYYTGTEYDELLERDNDQFPVKATFVNMINSLLDKGVDPATGTHGGAIELKFIFA